VAGNPEKQTFANVWGLLEICKIIGFWLSGVFKNFASYAGKQNLIFTLAA
jgi:hypothetical protein